MGLRHAVLAALLEAEATGYELSKRFNVSVANYWSATSQQLYRELERLEADGLVRGRLVEQERRPNKRVFALTQEGRRELHDFIAQPTRPTAIRDDLLVKVQAADDRDLAAVLAAVQERLRQARDKLAVYDQIRDRVLKGKDEETYLRQADQIGPYLVLMGGRMYEEQSIRWCNAVVARLRQRQDA
jgi:DNA-binding PadR family transcriptional regulator